MYSDYVKLFNKELMNQNIGGLLIKVITIDDVDKSPCTVHTDKYDIKFAIDIKASIASNLSKLKQCIKNCSKTLQ